MKLSALTLIRLFLDATTRHLWGWTPQPTFGSFLLQQFLGGDVQGRTLGGDPLLFPFHPCQIVLNGFQV
jgi:hypothetical protein